MMTTTRPTRRSPSFINRRPGAAALAIGVAGVSLLGAMPPPGGTSLAAGHPASLDARLAQSGDRLPLDALAVVPAGPFAPNAAAQQAFALNAAVPLSDAPNPAARPFILIGDAASRARALDCLTAAIYYESAGEGDAGEAAVAQVVLNRLRDPAYPKSVCAVVFDGTDRGAGCQFTFTCDGSMGHAASATGWARARRAAAAALAGKVVPAVGWSTHYHTQWVAPVWAPTLLKTAVIGAHIFYRAPAGGHQGRYAGAEPEIAQMAQRDAAATSPPVVVVAEPVTPPVASSPIIAVAAPATPPADQPGSLATVLPGV